MEVKENKMGFLTMIYFGENGQVVGKSTNDYKTLDEAEIQYHVALASAMQKKEYIKAIALMFDDEGLIQFRRVWERPIAIVEEGAEVEE